MNEALKQLETLLTQGAAGTPRFPPNSRYYATPTVSLVLPDGRMIPYLKRRFAPPPEQFALLHEHSVVAGDRIDLLAASALGDPELYWRICDANAAMRPDELTATLGRRLRITLPAGIPGVTDG
jgi:hypothetical protein